jgi:hypothetical protein
MSTPCWPNLRDTSSRRPSLGDVLVDRPPWALTGKRRLDRAPRYQVETASTRFVELCVSSNVCARFRYLLRATTSAIRAGRRCCAIGFWKSRLLHSMPSSRQSCFAFSMISATVGSDTVGPKVRRAQGGRRTRGLASAGARQLHQRCSRRDVVTIGRNTDAACGSPLPRRPSPASRSFRCRSPTCDPGLIHLIA